LQHVEFLCSFDGVREECCLPEAGPSTDHEYSAFAGTRSSEELFDPSALDGAPTQELWRGCDRQGTRYESEPWLRGGVRAPSSARDRPRGKGRLHGSVIGGWERALYLSFGPGWRTGCTHERRQRVKAPLGAASTRATYLRFDWR
jgi:hypothetical protein